MVVPQKKPSHLDKICGRYIFVLFLSKMFLNALSQESWKIEGYSPTTSAVKRTVLLVKN